MHQILCYFPRLNPTLSLSRSFFFARLAMSLAPYNFKKHRSLPRGMFLTQKIMFFNTQLNSRFLIFFSFFFQIRCPYKNSGYDCPNLDYSIVHKKALYIWQNHLLDPLKVGIYGVIDLNLLRFEFTTTSVRLWGEHYPTAYFWFFFFSGNAVGEKPLKVWNETIIYLWKKVFWWVEVTIQIFFCRELFLTNRCNSIRV